MSVKNFKELEFVLKNAFFKIKKDMKRLDEANKDTVKDLSVVRENLLEFNSIKQKLEAIEKKLDKKVEDSGELEGFGEEKSFFSKLFFWKTD